MDTQKSIEDVYNVDITWNKIVCGFEASFDGHIGKKVAMTTIGNIVSAMRYIIKVQQDNAYVDLLNT